MCVSWIFGISGKLYVEKEQKKGKYLLPPTVAPQGLVSESGTLRSVWK